MTRSFTFASAAACALLLLARTGASAADIYDAAVTHAGRPAADSARDALDHPAEILRLTGIKPGMKVADVLAGDGYYSELLSYVVGPTGHVSLINNTAFDDWSQPALKDRVSGDRLPNVTHQIVDLNGMNLPAASFDAVLLVKVYHDLYWVDSDPKSPWPKIDVSSVLDQLSRALKPGGVLLLVDHSAKQGHGKSDAGKLHRIEEAFAIRDFESHGFKVIATSDALRRPDDTRDLISYKGPALGKTDRFVVVFRKT
ncbi:MAG TPA: methyltransferase domain-containing protein [Steroidobacteraceae bacterium]|jgi:predicted methyltransferase